jgi:phospholipase C
MAYDQIQHVFVLMLENRSFDHLLGYSGLTGSDIATGLATSINGLNGTEQNTFGGVAYSVTKPADYAMTVDPGHEFPDVLCQLTGPGAVYPPGGNYPPIDNSGYAGSYVDACEKANQPRAPGEIMKCYSPDQLPV